MAIEKLNSGASWADITPLDSQFLYGYPNTERMSEGVHDPLLASALYLSDGSCGVLLVSADIIWFNKATTRSVRGRIASATGVPERHILLSASHTHSSPTPFDALFTEMDSTVPPADPNYRSRLEDGIVKAAVEAFHASEPARVGLAVADATGVGTNRHDPKAPSDLEVPVLMVQSADGERNLAMLLVLAMHPTVLHEDSRLVSGDFPGLARARIQKELVGADCPVLYHMGAAGNQSPRHVTESNTFAEAERLGGILANAVGRVYSAIAYEKTASVQCLTEEIELVPRQLPTQQQALQELQDARSRFEHLKQSGAPRTETRTAECDLFGAQETAVLSGAAEDGRLQKAVASCQPAEVQVIAIGPWRFVAWPGEVYVEFGLQIRTRDPKAFVITLANGELQAYLVTQEAIDKRFYEAGNAIFQSPDSPQKLVDTSLKLLASLD